RELLTNIALPIPVDALITDTAIRDTLKFFKLLDLAEARGFENGTAPLNPALLHENFPELWETVKTAEKWQGRVFSLANQALRKSLLLSLGPNKIGTPIRLGGLPETFKNPLLEQVLNLGWRLGKCRVGNTQANKWSLLLYRGEPSRASSPCTSELPLK